MITTIQVSFKTQVTYQIERTGSTFLVEVRPSGCRGSAPPVKVRPSGSTGSTSLVEVRPSGCRGSAPPVKVRPSGSTGSTSLVKVVGFYSASSLKQRSPSRHIVPLLIPSQSVFVLTP